MGISYMEKVYIANAWYPSDIPENLLLILSAPLVKMYDSYAFPHRVFARFSGGGDDGICTIIPPFSGTPPPIRLSAAS